MHFTTKWVCAFALLVGVSMTAQSADGPAPRESGFELGFGVGQGDLRVSLPGIPGSVGFDAAAYDFSFGYQFCRYFALEGAYLHGGSFSKTATDASTSPPQSVTISTDPQIYAASALGVLPLDQYFSLFVRAGVARWHSTLSVSDAAGRVDLSGSNTNFLWGAGGSLWVEGAQVRIEYEQIKTRQNLPGALPTDLSYPVDFRYRLISLSVTWVF